MYAVSVCSSEQGGPGESSLEGLATSTSLTPPLLWRYYQPSKACGLPLSWSEHVRERDTSMKQIFWCEVVTEINIILYVAFKFTERSMTMHLSAKIFPSTAEWPFPKPSMMIHGNIASALFAECPYPTWTMGFRCFPLGWTYDVSTPALRSP